MSWHTLLTLGAYVSGVLLVGDEALGRGAPQVLLAAAAAASVAAVLLSWHRAGSPGEPGSGTSGCQGPRRSTIPVAVAAAGLSLGAANGSYALEQALRPPLRTLGERLLAAEESPAVVIDGRLRADAEPVPYGANLAVDVDAVRVSGHWVATHGAVGVRVAGELARHRFDAWRAGRRLRLPVSLRAPQAYRNPGVPDRTRALALRGITWLGGTKSALQIEVVAPGGAIQELAAAARAHARRAVRHAMVPAFAFGHERSGLAAPGVVDGSNPEPPERTDAILRAGIVTAVLTGDRAGIPPEITDRLQRAGTFHVIAISGGNIAVLVALFAGVLRLLRVPARPAAALTAAGVASYGLIASGSASVSRATVVALLYLSARLVDVRPQGFAVLWAAMLALLLWSPLALFDPGFLLTSGATTAILLSSRCVPHARAVATTTDAGEGVVEVPPRIGRPPRSTEAEGAAGGGARWMLRWGRSVMIATVAADVALLPIAATLFSRVSVAGLVLNLAAIPLMTIAQLGGLVMFATDDVAPAVARLAGAVAAFAVRGLLGSATLVDVWPALSWRVPGSPLPAVALYYGAWFGWLGLRCLGCRRSARAVLPVVVFCTLWVAAAPAWLPSRLVPRPGPPAGRGAEPARQDLEQGLLTVVCLDVGQGDATLVRFPAGTTWLVDAGGIPGGSGFDVGARVVTPALWALGTRSLGALVVTHGDPDHVGGAMAIADAFRPREVWEGIPVAGNLLLTRLRTAARVVGSRWLARARGDRIDIGAVQVRVLHPARAEWERRRVRNDDSVTLDIRYRGTRVILPGDIGAAVERILAGELQRPDGAAAPTPVVPAADRNRDAQPLTILKVPHHGSASSSSAEFLRSLHPAVAVVSAGRGNRFGHPAPVAMARYAALGIPVLRTDRLGAVALVTDGVRAAAFSWSGHDWRLAWRSP